MKTPESKKTNLWKQVRPKSSPEAMRQTQRAVPQDATAPQPPRPGASLHMETDGIDDGHCCPGYGHR